MYDGDACKKRAAAAEMAGNLYENDCKNAFDEQQINIHIYLTIYTCE